MLRRRLMQFKDIVLFHFDKPFDGVYKDEYNNAICTCNNYTPTISTSIKKFGAGSFYHNNGATITVDTKLDYQDFTVEAWVYPTANSASYNWRQMFKVAGSGMMIAVAQASSVFHYAYWRPANTSGQDRYISSDVFKLNEWNHVAIVYNNSTVKAKIYINGVQIGNEESITWKSRPTHITIDIGGAGSLAYIDEFIFSKGIKYNGNFTPKDPHQYVDLGLPSGTKWATMNVGASSETDYGNYYMYGMGSKTYDSTDTTYAGTEDPLDHSVDTAAQVWGGSWHMPTRAQIQELIDNTTYQWVTNYKGSGINGGTFTAANGAVLFLPAAGYYLSTGLAYAGESCYYWSSSPDDSSFSYYLYCDSYNSHKSVTFGDRTYGHSVRPVIGNVIPKLYDYLYEDLSYGAKDTTKTAIGVCVIPGGVLPDGKARFMSLKGMTLTSPNEGGSDTYIYWGGYGSDIPSLTNFQTVVTGDTTATGTNSYGYVPKNGSYSSPPHIPSPIDYFSAYSSAGATSDLDGKANTEKILAIDNAASTAWQTAASITNTNSTATVHPAAQCCWRFNPGSTNKGDWYLPSIGELAFIMPNFSAINTAISDVSGVQLNISDNYWSSTECDYYDAWVEDTSAGYVDNVNKSDDYYVRAFYKL